MSKINLMIITELYIGKTNIVTSKWTYMTYEQLKGRSLEKVSQPKNNCILLMIDTLFTKLTSSMKTNT